MGFGLRYYLFPEDGSFRSVPQARFSRFWEGSIKDGFPEYAGMKVKCAEVLVKIENRRPVEIHRIATFFLEIRDDGTLDQGRAMGELISVLNSLEPRTTRKGNVIDASGAFYEKRYRDQYTWRIRGEQVQKIVGHVFKGRG